MSEEQKKENQTPEAEDVKEEQADPQKEVTSSQESAETTEEKASEAEVPQEDQKKDAASEDNEKYVRLMAEFQNYKKRVSKEKSDIRQYATEKLITELLPVN